MADDRPLRAAMDRLPVAMALCDPRADTPLLHVNDAFERLTLYRREEILGRNCRFLQGEGTDPRAVARLRDAIGRRRDVSVDILNYRADGTPFDNRLRVSLVLDAEGAPVGFLGIMTELTAADAEAGHRAGRPADETMLRELQHRVKNHLAMIVMMVRRQAERGADAAALEALGHRIESLMLLYEELSAAGRDEARHDGVAAGAYLGRVARTIAALDTRPSVRVDVDCEAVELPVETAAPLGLFLTEILTNALEHAFVGRGEGAVLVRFHCLPGGGWRLTVRDDGVGLPEGSVWPRRASPAPGGGEDGRRSGMGGGIVRALVASLRGRLTVGSTGRGTVVTLDVAPPGGGDAAPS
jgi:PAS domain S-box-containing protein